MIPYKIEFSELSKKIREKGFSKVLIQLPEGMQIYALEIAKNLKDFEVYISANPCYGACDIETYPDMLTIQFGHSRIPNINYPENIIFVEAFADVSFREVLEKFVGNTECEKVGILASIQHIKAMEYAKGFLEEHDIECFIGKGDRRITYPGQVLGCNFSTAREIKKYVDCFILLGTGVFHGLGAKMVTGKDVFVLDPYTNQITKIDESLFLKQRFGAIAKAQEARKFGIILSSKIGQRRFSLARRLMDSIKEAGKEGYFIVTDNIVPENMYYDVDVYINTACPRITYDDFKRFHKVVLSPIEAFIALGKKSWDSFGFDEIVEVD